MDSQVSHEMSTPRDNSSEQKNTTTFETALSNTAYSEETKILMHEKHTSDLLTDDDKESP